MTSGKLQTLVGYYRRYGLRKTALRVVTDTFRQAGIVRASRFIVLYPDSINSSAFPPDSPYRRELLTAAQLRPYQAQLPEDLPEWLLSAAEQSGDYCYAIFDDDQLISFGWYATRTARLFDRTFSFDPAFAYMYHGFTRPDYRGQRLHALGLAEAMTAFQQQDKSAIISTVNITNYRARQSSERLGFRNSGFIVQIGPGRWGALFVTPQVRTYRVQFSR